MALKLYYHPFSSFSQKALIGFYELAIDFETKAVGSGDQANQAELEALWPIGKFPVLRDDARGVTVPEASLIIQYIELHYGRRGSLIPVDRDEALRVHVLDRVFDNYLEHPLQAVVLDALQPPEARCPSTVDRAKAILARTYDVLEGALAADGWAAGPQFTLADCAAAPALFYANTIVSFGQHRRVASYYDRLLLRPSVARVVEEARPYRHFFPLAWPADYD